MVRVQAVRVKSGAIGHVASGDRLYKRLQSLGRAIALGLCRWDVEGLEHIPGDGPAIIAANHVSYLDPPLLGIVTPRPIRFVAKRELFQLPLLAGFLRLIGTFPVERSRPDLRAVRESLRVLQRGELLGIFPEGTRNKQGGLKPFLAGVGWLAIKARAPVVPVVIHGYRPLLPGSTWSRPGRLKIVCGKSLVFSPERYASGRRPFRTAATEEVYRAVDALLAALTRKRLPGAAVGEPAGASPLGASPAGASPVGASAAGASSAGASPAGASPVGAPPAGASMPDG